MGAEGSHATPEEIRQLVAETHFTEDEIQSLYKRFVTLSNSITSDGKFDCDEFRTALGISNPSFAKRIFSAFDDDGSLDIDFREFAKGLYSLSPRATTEEKARFCFNIYDIDKNGTISPNELKEVLYASLLQNKSVKLSEAQVESVISATFKRIDKNGDGEIQFAEFMSEAKRNPSILNCVSLDIERLF